VPVCVAVTVTPGITAPVASETVPVNAPVPADCAEREGADKTNSERIKHDKKKFLDTTPNPLVFVYTSLGTV
jgi:hypothetical protein